MNLLSKTASIVIAIAAVLTFYTALLHLTRRNKRRSFLFRVVRDLLVGLQTLQLYFVTQDLHLQYPFLLYLFVTLLFLSGPLNYIRYFMFFYPWRTNSHTHQNSDPARSRRLPRGDLGSIS
ncbi:hypothetical protein [Candidatus Villigracilis saccharophilus]|uniref:hypothetical protein n=1 Tax=Candidatus Villigracilis saccharophilus TaxID=3140684 RepID=UPI00313632A6|nr:hypothetical protein [Anaerolineales bacterium]